MTFTDIVSEVADRLDLSSTQALARIGRSVNERYREIASSIGLQTLVRTVVSATTTVGSRSLTFTNVEKLYSVFNPAFDPVVVLEEQTFDELRNQSEGVDPPQAYAIQLMGASSVTIYLDTVPSTAYVLSADAESNMATLSGSMVPAFAEDYHNLLTYGAMATELDKMEKYDLSQKQEDRYEQRLAALRMFIAKSAYLDLYQGKTSPDRTQNRLI